MKLGDKIPSFTLKNQDGEEVHIKNHIGKHPVILFFYPKNFTRGCTREACAFRDHYDIIKERGAVIFGISSDSVDSHANFKKQYNLPFDLLSDKSGVVRKLFNVPNEIFGIVPGRATYLFDKNGILIMQYNALFGAVDHVKQTLQKLDSIKG